VAEGQLEGEVTDPDEYVLHVPPLAAEPQAPEAPHPDEHDEYEYGVVDHDPSEQVEVRTTVEQAAPEGADDEYEVHEPPCAVTPQPPDAAQDGWLTVHEPFE